MEDVISLTAETVVRQIEHTSVCAKVRRTTGLRYCYNPSGTFRLFRYSTDIETSHSNNDFNGFRTTDILQKLPSFRQFLSVLDSFSFPDARSSGQPSQGRLQRLHPRLEILNFLSYYGIRWAGSAKTPPPPQVYLYWTCVYRVSVSYRASQVQTITVQIVPIGATLCMKVTSNGLARPPNLFPVVPSSPPIS